ACRSVPVPARGAGLTPPLSLVLVTTKVDRSDRSSRLSRNRLAVGRRRRRAGRRRGRGPDWRVRSEEAKNMMQHLPFEDGVRYHKNALDPGVQTIHPCKAGAGDGVAWRHDLTG